MVARGDLGVEVPIEEIAVIQKNIIAKANLAGKPVITATQMLESMVSSRLPTRAESTDVANAILDGTDCVMLSGECAMGQYPEEAVAMLGKIAAATEPKRQAKWRKTLRKDAQKVATAPQAMAVVVEQALEIAPFAAVMVPTRTGDTARMISRFKPNVWIVARGLAFSYGVAPLHDSADREDWSAFATEWLRAEQVEGKLVLLVAAGSSSRPDANHRIEFLRVGEAAKAAVR
jgi:pyruvate kinase